VLKFHNVSIDVSGQTTKPVLAEAFALAGARCKMQSSRHRAPAKHPVDEERIKSRAEIDQEIFVLGRLSICVGCAI
jgi:hypothetical protein